MFLGLIVPSVASNSSRTTTLLAFIVRRAVGNTHYRMHKIVRTFICLLDVLQQTDTPYGTPHGSFSGGSYSSLSSMQTPPHSLSGYSPMTHLHGLPSSYHSTPGRSGAHANSLQVPYMQRTIIEDTLFLYPLCGKTGRNLASHSHYKQRKLATSKYVL